jgi:hypothetical protein
MANEKETNSWPELAIGLYDKLTGRGAEITYEFDNFELYVPSGTSSDASSAKWKMNGTLRVRTTDRENAGSAQETK